jgi:integrase
MCRITELGGFAHAAPLCRLSDDGQWCALKIVSDILDHASLAITGDIYGHVSPDVSREAAAKLAAALSE